MDTRITAEEVLKGDALVWRNETLIVEDTVLNDEGNKIVIYCHGGKEVAISPQAVMTILSDEDLYDEY